MFCAEDFARPCPSSSFGCWLIEREREREREREAENVAGYEVLFWWRVRTKDCIASKPIIILMGTIIGPRTFYLNGKPLSKFGAQRA